MAIAIPIDRDKIADFCRRHNIVRMALFGSVVRDDFTDRSDVDVLVEFEAGKTPGLAFFGMGSELGEIIGQQVDLNTEGSLHRLFKTQVMRDAVSIYEQT